MGALQLQRQDELAVGATVLPARVCEGRHRGHVRAGGVGSGPFPPAKRNPQGTMMGAAHAAYMRLVPLA